MGLFKKKKKKERKKLTEQQFVTRMSRIIFAVMIIVVLGVVVYQSYKSFTDSTNSQNSVFSSLNEQCKLSDITTKTISDTDKEGLKTKLENANIDIFDGLNVSFSKFSNLSSGEEFTLTGIELICFVNELLDVGTNYYSMIYYDVEIVSSTTIKCVAETNFRNLCRFSNDQLKLYNTMGYTVPDKVYLTTSTTLGESLSSDIVFNTLDSNKSLQAKNFVNNSRTNFAVENVLYNTLISTLNNFCDKTNMSYTFHSGLITFYNIV